jgi:1-aminocyclopropane-1-carboxylate deaminase
MTFSNSFIQLPSPLQRINDERLAAANVTLYLKRDDLIHPDIPGNKWRKLKYNLEEAKKQKAHALLTFGGAYSNHLRAVAAAGQLFNFSTIGLVRGEEHVPLNWSLTYAKSHGMQLHYVDRESYRYKHEPSFIASLHERFGDFYLLPEGGSNALAVKGCIELVNEIDIKFDTICCAVGTGATLAGIAAGLKPHQNAIGFSALKGGSFLTSDVAALQNTTFHKITGNWRIETDYHFGGFAKTTPKLEDFIADFHMRHHILLERIYVAKMVYGMFDLISRAVIPPNSTIIGVITGKPENT